MKRIVLVAAALAVSASAAYAVVGVTNTKHDLSGTSSMTGGGANQKCIYCHTPHNPQISVPLWNRTNGSAIAPTYNSATMTTVANAATVSVTSISGFCMSCHDGATSMGAIKNKAGATDQGLTIQTISGANAKNNLGTDLSNDHPVGFNYASAKAAETDGGLVDITTVKTAMPNSFFGGAAELMECATCHKVHDNTVTPFLRMNNAGSNLCLACHVK